MFPLLSSILPSVSDSVVEVWAKPVSDFNTKYSGVIDCFSIHADGCMEIMKMLVKVKLDSLICKNSNQLESKQTSWEKFCTSVLFNDVIIIATIFLTVDQF